MIDGKESETTLKIGDNAPDFTLKSHNEGELNLAWYQGRKNVVLAFYPGDWTPVCSNQMPEYNKLLDKFDACNTQVLGISTDSLPSHKAWAKSLGGLNFPLMSDFFPHGEVSQKYGVLSPTGYAMRFLFLIDKNGIIRFIEDIGFGNLPDNDKLFDEIKKLL